jgi:hypothetical protein
MSERPPIRMVRRGSFLAPLTPADAEAVELLPAGKEMAVRVSLGARSVPGLRFYWAMLGLVCDNLDQPLRPETLHEWIKLKCGHAEPIKLKNGETAWVPGSISFARMDQAEFRKFLEDAKTLIVTQLIPKLGKETLEREAWAMIGGVNA